MASHLSESKRAAPEQLTSHQPHTRRRSQRDRLIEPDAALGCTLPLAVAVCVVLRDASADWWGQTTQPPPSERNKDTGLAVTVAVRALCRCCDTGLVSHVDTPDAAS